MSVVERSTVENLKAIVNDTQNLRWIILSAFITVLWNHSECSCFPLSMGKGSLAAKQMLLVICLDKEVRLVSTLTHDMCTHIFSLLD